MNGYEVGDKVRIVSDKSLSHRWDDEGEMDKWLGKVMTIREVQEDSFKMMEDSSEWDDGWYWFPEMIEGLAEDEAVVDIDAEELLEVLRL